MNEVVKLKPYVKSYIWGGNFFRQFGKSDLDIIAELWELSIRGDCSCFIASGEQINQRLDKAITNEDIGPVSERFPYFPLLIKFKLLKGNKFYLILKFLFCFLNSLGFTLSKVIRPFKPGFSILIGFY